MARATPHLVEKLREAAANIENSGDYNWGHVGRCNCGHLVRTMTDLSSRDIFKIAQSNYVDEWTEFANDYCPADGASIDRLTDVLLGAGFELKDVHQLEYLTNPKVLAAIPGGPRHLEKGKASDAALYMRTWASLLELEIKAQSASAQTAAPATARTEKTEKASVTA